MAEPKSNDLMEKIVSLCKRRGFIFQSSEIYGGINGFWDFGPLGAELKRNIRDRWWNDMVRQRDDVVGIESSIIMHPKVWEASGHVGGFTDPLVDCKVSRQRYRADQIFFAAVVVDGKTVGYVSALESDQIAAELQTKAETLKRKQSIQGKLEPVQAREFTEATPELVPLIPSPATGEPGSLTPPRGFNMMLETNVGALRDASSIAYLRPETAQGMFVDFNAILDTGRVKIPFGIAQIGKSFRNEITPRNFIFRSREFEQMEMEYFISDQDDWQKWYRYWIDWCRDWLRSIGLPDALLSESVHPQEKLAFYSKGTTDIMFHFPFGVQELWGIAARGDYDLSQHAKFSGAPMTYFDEATKRRYVPHVIEPAVGVDRILLAILCSAYAEDEAPDEKGKMEARVVMKFHPRIAPIKVAVFPLLKNKPALVQKAQAVRDLLRPHMTVFYDEAGAIGRRYRRQDEVGTPFGVTIDFDTLGEKPELLDTVTLRDRDTMKQERVKIADLVPLLLENLPLMSEAPQSEPEVLKRAPTLYVIIVIKLLKGLLFVVLGFAVYSLSDNNLPAEYQEILQWLRLNPERKFWSDLATRVGDLTEGGMVRVAIGTLIYSLFSLVEGVGLMFRVSWAGWLAIGESMFFIPIEVHKIVEDFNWVVFVILILNIFIVWYLFQNRQRLFHHHHRH